jgi:hypothetical protein
MLIAYGDELYEDPLTVKRTSSGSTNKLSGLRSYRIEVRWCILFHDRSMTVP